MQNETRSLEFGWFLPTGGDTVTYGTKDGIVPPSMELFEKIALAAEAAGFEYLLVPVATACWDAYISSAMVLARTRSIRMLVAARPGYVTPVLLARMLGAMDRLSGGRVAVNLIAGQSDDEALQDGIQLAKDDRYAQMEEDVTIMKALWTDSAPLHFDGRFHTLQGARSIPRPRKPPRFYLGGGSPQAWALSAKHSDVHLFWGDTVETIAANMAVIKDLAASHGRERDIGFGMRLQIICRQTESQAWDAAHALLAGVTEADTALIRKHYASSVANQRVQELARTHGELIAPHLWTGITRVRPGAGIVVVGNPQQCADTLQQFIDIGCHSFCLSGYLHDEEATRFAQMVRPLLAQRNPGRVPILPEP
jgi:alkanesulfonate monooxygenase